MEAHHPESKPSRYIRHIAARGEQFPYSHTATFHHDTGHEGFGAWAMEYHHDFKNRMTDGRSDPGDITREKSAPPYAHHPHKHFNDIVSVTAAVSDVRRKNLVNLLRAMGYEVRARGDVTVCRGNENIVKLVPRTNEGYAIQRIVVSLMRPKDGQRVYRFGPDVTLTFGDGLEAEWTFGRIDEGE